MANGSLYEPQDASTQEISDNLGFDQTQPNDLTQRDISCPNLKRGVEQFMNRVLGPLL